MKSLARSFVWWPGLDKGVESKVKLCAPCQQNRKLPATVPIQPWERPKRPWTRLHIDYAGPLHVVDAFLKWLDVKLIKRATSSSALRSIFVTHSIPALLVSDNGSVFTSDEFKDFLKQKSIRHNTSAPYHPASNGLAERNVQTF